MSQRATLAAVQPKERESGYKADALSIDSLVNPKEIQRCFEEY